MPRAAGDNLALLPGLPAALLLGLPAALLLGLPAALLPGLPSRLIAAFAMIRWDKRQGPGFYCPRVLLPQNMKPRPKAGLVRFSDGAADQFSIE